MCAARHFEEDVKCKLVSRVGYVTWNCMRRAVRQFDKDVKCTQASITSRICYIKPEAHNPKRITLSQCRRFLGNHSKFTFQYGVTDKRDCRASAQEKWNRDVNDALQNTITVLQRKIRPKSEYPQNKTKSITHDMHRQSLVVLDDHKRK